MGHTGITLGNGLINRGGLILRDGLINELIRYSLQSPNIIRE